MSVPQGPRPERAFDGTLLAFGLVLGFVSSWCGIGGGLFAVPLLHFGRKLELKRAVASALVVVFATALASTVVELVEPNPSLRPVIVLPLVAGVLVGAPLGFAALQRIPVGLLRKLFVVVLVVAAWRVFASDAGGSPVRTANDVFANLALAAMVGFGGGFVAPLLGIGGGLLMVPGLFLLHGLHFEEARASSLCAAVVSSSRALALHARAGRVAWGPALSIGAGALLGAASGVAVLARYGLADEARTLFSVVLAFVAVRFALAAWRERAGGA